MEIEDLIKLLETEPKSSLARCIAMMHRMGAITEEKAQRLLVEYTQLNVSDTADPFPNNIWHIFIGCGSEHNPPHIHIHNIPQDFVCRFDINTCQTIYEDSLADEKAIWDNRRKRTTNIQNMRGISFEEISARLMDWYKQESTYKARILPSTTNYQQTVNYWNAAYGDKVGIVQYKRELDKEFITPQTNHELKSIIIDRIEKEGTSCNLNDIDVSKIKDMGALFFNLDFNGRINQWDVSHVLNTQMMFYGSSFNQDISMWKIHPQCQTYGMFDNCSIEDKNKPKVIQ